MSMEFKFERNEELKAIIRCQKKFSNNEETSEVLKSFSVSSEDTNWSEESINEYILTVTDRNIYLEGIYRKVLGGLPEVLNVSKIPLEKIENFDVDKKDEFEHITITCNKDKIFKLIHKSRYNNYEATEIKDLFFTREEEYI